MTEINHNVFARLADELPANAARIDNPIFTTKITTPAFKLTGTGDLTGKVLLSDADGDASWGCVKSDKIITVGSTGCNFTTISAALTAITDASALNRYTVLVYPGVYEEIVKCKDYISLIGTDVESCIIEMVNAL